MLTDATLIPAPLPFHLSLASRYVDWMHQRAGRGRLRGMFVFKLHEDGGTIEFWNGTRVDVLGLMAMGLPEEVATSMWYIVRTYDPEEEVIALVADRADGSYSFMRL